MVLVVAKISVNEAYRDQVRRTATSDRFARHVPVLHRRNICFTSISTNITAVKTPPTGSASIDFGYLKDRPQTTQDSSTLLWDTDKGVILYPTLRQTRPRSH
jgi:hypothetical protein